MERLVANLIGAVRREILNGRAYLVAPMTTLAPKVLHGSRGALYYPPEEIQRSADAWNGMPIVVNHPSINNQPVSARRPDILRKYGIGTVFATNYSGKLTHEGWFDIERTREVDARILKSIEDGKPIELSTGLYTDNEPAQNGANHEGTPYTHVARNYRPDHLAILPDAKGACSLNDGCGVLVNKEDLTSTFAELYSGVGQFLGITDNANPQGCNQFVPCNDTADSHDEAGSLHMAMARHLQRIGGDHEQVDVHLKEADRLITKAKSMRDKQRSERAKMSKNAFCQTGEGGGVDPSCPSGGGEGSGSGGKGSKGKGSKKDEFDVGEVDQSTTVTGNPTVDRAFSHEGSRVERAKAVYDASKHIGDLRQSGKSEGITDADLEKHIDKIFEGASLAEIKEGEKALDAFSSKRTKGDILKAMKANFVNRVGTVSRVTNESNTNSEATENHAEHDQQSHAGSGEGSEEMSVGEVVPESVSKGVKLMQRRLGNQHVKDWKAFEFAAEDAYFNISGADKDFPTKGRSIEEKKQGRKDYARAIRKEYQRQLGTQNSNTSSEESADMDRKATITFLTTNCECWKGKDKLLENRELFDDATLNQLKTNAETATNNQLVFNQLRESVGAPATLVANEMPAFIKAKIDAKKKKDDDEDDEEEDDEDEEYTKKGPKGDKGAKGDKGDKGSPTKNERNRQMTANEWLDSAPADIQSAVRNAMEIERREKSALIERLTANVKDADLKSRLIANHQRKDLATLRDEVAALPAVATGNGHVDGRFSDYLRPNYAGAAGGPAFGLTDNEASDVLDLESKRTEYLRNERKASQRELEMA